jgi:hypothetical protein
MNIEDLDIRELFLEGVLTANAVRILLMEEFEKNYWAAEHCDFIGPLQAAFVEKWEKGLTIPTSIEETLG